MPRNLGAVPEDAGYKQARFAAQEQTAYKESMDGPRQSRSKERDPLLIRIPESEPLWLLDFAEVTGHNLESRGREEVNRLLQAGWRLLHIYTLKYEEDGVWRERPMAILGRLREHAEPKGFDVLSPRC